ncbi:MAG: DsrE family protein [Abditibacteriales bacterium]|nr:DsrE family protein [Abditibacteriales bacterium]MDW8368224.1 DsrE family protein [Abditibacteriales bacterium]
MSQKHILFTLNHAPFGTIYHSEGLRAALGATAGIEENTVDVVYLGDGVYYTLKSVDRNDTRVFLETLSTLGVTLKAERESLEERGVQADALAEDVEVISRAEVRGLIDKADMVIGF